ncbi:MAG: single-stranded-DNA-specific exonuclease RecJ [Anaerolineae bacterium]|nr:MAG: single-stranded-DNA-specific exonuclease RecJ [Anaerolineae bacterium]
MPIKRWIRPESSQDGFGSRLTAKILERRGLTTEGAIEAFLNRQYMQETDPFQLSDMDRAIDRLQAARRAGERVVVYGDYDADGTTATALLTHMFSSLGLDTGWYIPNRFAEGYGLNESALAQIHQGGAAVVVSVDCGIRSNEIVESANALGLDLIITDHHLPGPELPPALAVIDPNRTDDPYPFKGLAGVGLAYKLAQGLVQQSGEADVEKYLDLVAVGTVADLAPLIDENRSLVSAGIEQMNVAARPGLRALAEFAGHGQGSISSSSIGFGLGPRLNAAGRLADASLAVQLLLATEGSEAWEHAGKLDRLNRERRQLMTETLERARTLAQEQPHSENLLMAADDEFHEGVLGLVAGRLAEEFYRPALVARIEGNVLRGSARSIPEFHITEALQACDDLLLRFGGHAQAAGFSLLAENRQAFVARLSELAAERLDGLDLRPRLELDASVSFDELDEDLMAFIDRLQPCGQANPYPVFSTSGVEVHSKRTVGQGGRHLKLTVRHAGRVFDAIAFGFGDQTAALPDRLELAYRLERNEFRGAVSLQLNVQDFRPL